MLRGRQEQQDLIEGLLRRAHEGESAAVVLRGEPGIGKTALLDFARDKATGMAVLRTVGIESETDLPFAGLHQLLRPALDQLTSLPEPQRLALMSVFGLAPSSGPSRDDAGDRFLVGLGVLSLLSEIAPVLCLIDDAHWIDRASADALLFTARRLYRDSIVMIFSARDYPGVFRAPGLLEQLIAGLNEADAAALLGDRQVSLSSVLRNQLITATRGNPLALIELSASPHTFRTGAFRFRGNGPLPLTRRVLDAYDQQIRDLPPDTRTALLTAAADDSGDLGLLHRAGLCAGDLHLAEERQLVSITGDTLEFRHPLIRSAAYHSATQRERGAVHRALADACTGPGNADRRAWHLALAADGPDEQIAVDLERAGYRAAGRNAHDAAAAAYGRAAQLSQDSVAEARRLVLAAEASADGGQLKTARALAERAERVTADPELTRRLSWLRAGADVAGGSVLSASTLNLAAASTAGVDRARALWMVLEAVHASWQAAFDAEKITSAIDQLDELGQPGGAAGHELMPLVWLIRWNVAMVLGRSTEGYAPLDTVMADAVATASAVSPRCLILVASGADVAGRDDAMAEAAAACVAQARDRGLIGLLPGGLSQLAWAETALGRYRDAAVNATEGRQLASDLGQPFWASWLNGTLAYLAAVQGDESCCREYATVARQIGESVVSQAWANAALVLLDLGAGRVAEAFERVEAVARGSARHHPDVTRVAPDHVEAAIRLGRPDEAANALARLARWAPLVGQPWIAALQARCEALIAPEGDAESHYRRALKLHQTGTRPFDQARTQLLYGEWLRRARRKREARIQLHASLAAFHELGADPWVRRAQAELTATGAPAPRTASPDILAALTPQELQITRLAARGLANRDIAAQLFLSPRTVAYHLYKAYPKLGINSRAELPSLMPGT